MSKCFGGVATQRDVGMMLWIDPVSEPLLVSDSDAVFELVRRPSEPVIDSATDRLSENDCVVVSGSVSVNEKDIVPSPVGDGVATSVSDADCDSDTVIVSDIVNVPRTPPRLPPDPVPDRLKLNVSLAVAVRDVDSVNVTESVGTCDSVVEIVWVCVPVTSPVDERVSVGGKVFDTVNVCVVVNVGGGVHVADVVRRWVFDAVGTGVYVRVAVMVSETETEPDVVGFNEPDSDCVSSSDSDGEPVTLLLVGVTCRESVPLCVWNEVDTVSAKVAVLVTVCFSVSVSVPDSTIVIVGLCVMIDAVSSGVGDIDVVCVTFCDTVALVSSDPVCVVVNVCASVKVLDGVSGIDDVAVYVNSFDGDCVCTCVSVGVGGGV